MVTAAQCAQKHDWVKKERDETFFTLISIQPVIRLSVMKAHKTAAFK